MTPHQSFARTSQMPASPFAVPDKIFGLTLSLDFIDRGTHCAWALSATGSAQARGPREKPSKPSPGGKVAERKRGRMRNAGSNLTVCCTV